MVMCAVSSGGRGARGRRRRYDGAASGSGTARVMTVVLVAVLAVMGVLRWVQRIASDALGLGGSSRVRVAGRSGSLLASEQPER